MHWLKNGRERDEEMTKVKEQPKLKKMRFIDLIYRDRYLLLMMVPFLLWYVFFYYMPMSGILMAFKDYSPFKGLADSEWVGFKHFVEFFTENPYAWRLIRNTLLINIYSLIFTFPLPIILAILFNELRSKSYKTMVQTISYMPHFISSVVVAGIVVTMLSPSAGIVNQLLEKIGLQKIYFLTKPEYFRTIFISMGAWMGTGFSSIIYTSAICSIDESLYEAAKIDGASRFQRLWHITLPGLIPTIAIMLLTRVGSLLEVGSDTIILLYQPITFETADVISTYNLRMGLQSADPQFSSATAIGLMNSVISLILVVGANYVSKRTTEAGLF